MLDSKQKEIENQIHGLILSLNELGDKELGVVQEGGAPVAHALKKLEHLQA
jgi:hypothetical protein